VTARELAIDPGLVEKDYWIMHALWGLQHLGLGFELTGGTSLSKSYQLIHRFSEDIDILIYPTMTFLEDPIRTSRGRSRRGALSMMDCPPASPSPVSRGASRDDAFDDVRMRSAGIRLHYPALNPLPEGVKTGILLEAGFDQVAPSWPCRISSWAYDGAVQAGVVDLTDNRAHDVDCYEPGYTLVEKLQTISTKFRRQQETGTLPQNFLRHCYDVYCLREDPSVKGFVGTDAYLVHKAARFPSADNQRFQATRRFCLMMATRVGFSSAPICRHPPFISRATAVRSPFGADRGARSRAITIRRPQPILSPAIAVRL
jgi:hypothetical protein